MCHQPGGIIFALLAERLFTSGQAWRHPAALLVFHQNEAMAVPLQRRPRSPDQPAARHARPSWDSIGIDSSLAGARPHPGSTSGVVKPSQAACWRPLHDKRPREGPPSSCADPAPHASGGHATRQAPASSARQQRLPHQGPGPPPARPDGLHGWPTPPATGRGACRPPRTPLSTPVA